MKTLRKRLAWIGLGAVCWSWGAYPHHLAHHIGTLIFIAGLGTAGFLSYVVPRRWQ